MFLSCTSQGVDIVVKWLISLVVTSNHKCLNKVVSNKLALNYFRAWNPTTKVVHLHNSFYALICTFMIIFMFCISTAPKLVLIGKEVRKLPPNCSVNTGVDNTKTVQVALNV